MIRKPVDAAFREKVREWQVELAGNLKSVEALVTKIRRRSGCRRRRDPIGRSPGYSRSAESNDTD